jgi:hypothetical protein
MVDRGPIGFSRLRVGGLFALGKLIFEIIDESLGTYWLPNFFV